MPPIVFGGIWDVLSNIGKHIAEAVWVALLWLITLAFEILGWVLGLVWAIRLLKELYVLRMSLWCYTK